MRLIPRASLLVGCQGSRGHIRIPLDVLITGDRSSCFVADFFFIVFLKIIFFLQISVYKYIRLAITFQDGGSGYQTNKR